MKKVSYCLFATPLGWCGIAWSEAPNTGAPPAVTFLQLPEATMELTESRIAQVSGASKASEPPFQIATIINRVCKHLQGELQDFRDIPVDLRGAGPFVQKVCEAARKIPAGQTATYTELATALGQPAAARAVGRALGRNPIPLIIPCHRILAARGKPGGFSAHGGRATKAKLLAIEGAVVNLCLEFDGPC
jgi:O-6-methylguanine DNA methyltransferase